MGLNEDGFYSVEILVGMTILVLVVAIVAGYSKYNLKAAKKSDGLNTSMEMATSYLEKSKTALANPDTLKVLLDSVGTSAYTRNSTETSQGKTFLVAVKFQRLSPTANLMKIKTTVRWDESKSNIMGTVFPFTP